MPNQLLYALVLGLGMVIGTQAFVVCVGWCRSSAPTIDPVQFLQGDIEPDFDTEEVRSVRGIPENGRVSPQVFMVMCDANEDQILDLEEFDGCLKGIGKARQREEGFMTLDEDGDDQLSAAELNEFELTMKSSGDCYKDTVAKCAASFVMYERARGVTRQGLCKGLTFYHGCVLRAAKSCDDERLDGLQAVFDWTQEAMAKPCSAKARIPLSATEISALRCSGELSRGLHSSQPPCAAMATFSECLQTEAGAKDGEKMFEDAAQLAGCDKK